MVHYIKTVNHVKNTLAVYIPMFVSMQVKKEVMRAATENDFSNATNLANYLVHKHLPFRLAHEITGKIVLYAIDHSVLLKDVNLEIYKSFCEIIEEDVYHALQIEAVIAWAIMTKTGLDAFKAKNRAMVGLLTVAPALLLTLFSENMYIYAMSVAGYISIILEIIIPIWARRRQLLAPCGFLLNRHEADK